MNRKLSAGIKLSIRVRLNSDAVNCHPDGNCRLTMNVRPWGIYDKMVLEVKSDESYRCDYGLDSWDRILDSRRIFRRWRSGGDLLPPSGACDEGHKPIGRG